MAPWPGPSHPQGPAGPSPSGPATPNGPQPSGPPPGNPKTSENRGTGAPWPPRPQGPSGPGGPTGPGRAADDLLFAALDEILDDLKTPTRRDLSPICTVGTVATTGGPAGRAGGPPSPGPVADFCLPVWPGTLELAASITAAVRAERGYQPPLPGEPPVPGQPQPQPMPAPPPPLGTGALYDALPRP